MAIRKDCYSAIIKQTVYELTVDEYQLGGITRCENLRKRCDNKKMENALSDALCEKEDLDYVILRVVCIKKFDNETQKWKVMFYKKKIIRNCNCVPEYKEVKGNEKVSTNDQLSAPSASPEQRSQNRLVEFQKCFAEFMFNEGFDASEFSLSDLTPGSACCRQLERAPQGNFN